MKTAIITLEIALDTLENNEPVFRAEGNTTQADLESAGAAEIRQALHILRAVNEARSPIYPEPSAIPGVDPEEWNAKGPLIIKGIEQNQKILHTIPSQ